MCFSVLAIVVDVQQANLLYDQIIYCAWTANFWMTATNGSASNHHVDAVDKRVWKVLESFNRLPNSNYILILPALMFR